MTGTQTIAPGETTTISSDGTAGEWTSCDDAVATVDISTGEVTGVTAGTADITYTVGGTACPDASTITITVEPNCPADLVVTYDDVSHCGGRHQRYQVQYLIQQNHIRIPLMVRTVMEMDGTVGLLISLLMALQ